MFKSFERTQAEYHSAQARVARAHGAMRMAEEHEELAEHFRGQAITRQAFTVGAVVWVAILVAAFFVVWVLAQ